MSRFRLLGRLTRLSWLAGLVWLTVAAIPAPAQDRVRVEFSSDPLRNTNLAVIERGGYAFAPLEDLARIFKLRTYENHAASKYEVKSGGYAVKITAGNPYVVVRDAEQNASVYQFPSPAFRSDGRYYAPLGAMAAILDYILPGEIAFDKGRDRLLVSGGGSSPLLSPYDVAGVEFEEKANGYLIRLRCTKKIKDYESWVKPSGEDSWLYITLADAKADVKRLQSATTPGFVKKVMVFQSATSVQLTFRMKGRVNATELLPAEGSDDILVTLHKPSAQPSASSPTPTYDETVARERERWKLDVVVIDAGHGGDDPGTIGVNNTREKDVVLDVSKKLSNLIRKNLPDVRVVQTRESDEFIELYRRGQIANGSNGKLFISIHCNSMPRKPHSTNGFEIYLLRPGKTDAAIRIAERENAVVQMEVGHEDRYKELTEENFILLTMAQSGYMKFSEDFAEHLQQEMGKHLPLENNGVRQAGFYVLVGASMPNVLVEIGYLSNREEERYLKSETGKQRIAEAIFNAVKRYKQAYEKTLGKG